MLAHLQGSIQFFSEKYINWIGHIPGIEPDYSKSVTITEMNTTNLYVKRLPLFRIIQKGYRRGGVINHNIIHRNYVRSNNNNISNNQRHS